MSIICLALTTLAFALFASAGGPHARRFGLAQDKPAKRRRRYIAGAVLVAALPPAIAATGWVFGRILWSGAVILGAGLVFASLNLRKAP